MKYERRELVTRGVEYYPDSGTLLLICCPECGRENWALQVASGTCAWCGFDAKTLLNNKDDGNKSNNSKDKDS